MSQSPEGPAPDAALGSPLERLRIRHLRLLSLIDTQGSLTAAAQALHISQPAATAMLRELEQALGATLITRSATGSHLTPAGRIAWQRLQHALGALRHAADAIAAAPDLPTVHLGMVPAAGVAVVPRLVGALTQAGRLPRLVLHEANVPRLINGLLRGDIDCLIGRLDPSDASPEFLRELVSENLWTEQLAVAAAIDHPLAKAGALDTAALLAADWIVAPAGTRIRQLFDQRFHQAGVMPPTPRIESFSLHTNLCVVADSALLTIAPFTAVTHYAARGRVVPLALTEPFTPGEMVFVRRRGVALPAVDDIAAALRQTQG
ncbi:LysR family transcriptional regulator [Achromobacter sp. GG226]|uniref:LysR family transcriptional regulator n=1 Tax=Verticiella alkaliphila TaxID=2779529 RepID=UPI001C0D803A|nr:LysR substrate-binding domain-containing protein [Verticiella sp. GG226]MBU4612243.1 LysR family transcriptional regulator [Verticiella sp. GG226]